MSNEYRDLGMDRPIARRDFLNGVAVGITGATAALGGMQARAGQTPRRNRSIIRRYDPDCAANIRHRRRNWIGSAKARIRIPRSLTAIFAKSTTW
jgi:hypothetical protein